MGGDACVIASWPSAGAAAPRVKPPANVALLFRSSRRLKRFEPIGLSFADEPERKSLTRSRKYTPVRSIVLSDHPLKSEVVMRMRIVTEGRAWKPERLRI